METVRQRAVLLVGGLDPTGQAGLARDITAVADERLVPAPVATGITAQTSQRFDGVDVIDADRVVDQCIAATTEHDITCIKTGALFSADQVIRLATFVQDRGLRLVVDPVLTTTSGGPILGEAGIHALRKHLLPLATLVTPNEDEALRLTGAANLNEGVDALLRDGAKHVLLTRGGLEPDLLVTESTRHELAATPQSGRHRGTGCRLAARISAHLAHGLDVETAVRAAHRTLQAELELDATNQNETGARLAHLRELEDHLPRILAELRYEHIPEVGMNIAYGRPGAQDPRRDVAGLAGRITIAGYDRDVTGRITYGGPHHTGRIVCVLQEYDPDARIVLNHRYDDAFLDAARRHGLVASGFERQDEPENAPSSMEWGVRHAIEANGDKVPDVIYDRGGDNKEAMIRVIAKDPEDLVQKLRLMHDTTARIHDPDGRDEQDPRPLPSTPSSVTP